MFSRTSPLNFSPVSTSSILTEERSTCTNLDTIKNLNTEELIDYLQSRNDLDLREEDFEVLRNERISGGDFLITTKEEYRSYGMRAGPAKRLSNFAKKLTEVKMKEEGSELLSSLTDSTLVEERYKRYAAEAGDTRYM